LYFTCFPDSRKSAFSRDIFYLVPRKSVECDCEARRLLVPLTPCSRPLDNYTVIFFVHRLPHATLGPVTGRYARATPGYPGRMGTLADFLRKELD
jgi:hypothetical protein